MLLLLPKGRFLENRYPLTYSWGVGSKGQEIPPDLPLV
jgi:hypothetical protein